MTHRSYPLQNKVAIVIDAAHGIGAEIARQLARAGAQVVVNYRTVQRQAAQKVEEEIFAGGGRAWAVPADPFSETGARFLLTQTQQGFGEPDIIVVINELTDSSRLHRFGTHADKVWLVQAPSCVHQPCRIAGDLAPDAAYALRRTINAAFTSTLQAAKKWRNGSCRMVIRHLPCIRRKSCASNAGDSPARYKRVTPLISRLSIPG